MPSQYYGNVLVTSASMKVPLFRALQEAAYKLHPNIKVFAGDSCKNALTRYVADFFWKMPLIDQAEIDTLISECKNRDIRIVVPTRDGELLFWAKNRSRFEEKGIDVLVSSFASAQICLDKLAFSKFGEKNALPFIPSGLHPDEIKNSTFVVKERFGAGSLSIGLNLTRNAALKHGATMKSPIYQPFIQGAEVSIDAWLDRKHRVKGIVLRKRDLVADGESLVTTTFRDSEIEATANKALQTLELNGPCVMQVFIDANKKIHIIECNSRIGGASTASIAAGLDVFYWSFLESTGVDVSNFPFNRVQGEIRQIRVPHDIHVNITL